MQGGNRPGHCSSLEARGRKIVEQLGGEWRAQHGGMCRCPGHDDRRPSLSVRPGERQLLFHCFAGCETGRIIRALNALRLPGAEPSIRGEGTGPAPADSGRRNRGAAARLWASSRPLGGSLAEAYLEGRGLIGLAAADLRFHPRTPYGRSAQAIYRPALLAAVRDDVGLLAVQRIFLDPKTAGLADLPLPKRALGRLGHGAVRLRPPEAGVLGWAEGIESAMAATLLTGVPCWATLGTERFARVALPAVVERLILFLDNDTGGRRAEKLARECCGGGRAAIEARYPADDGADWNDILLGLRVGASRV